MKTVRSNWDDLYETEIDMMPTETQMDDASWGCRLGGVILLSTPKDPDTQKSYMVEIDVESLQEMIAACKRISSEHVALP